MKQSNDAQFVDRRRWLAKRVFAWSSLAVVVLIDSACGTETRAQQVVKSETPTTALTDSYNTQGVQMVVRPAETRPGDSVYIKYVRPEGEARQLSLGSFVVLRQGGRDLKLLIVRDVFPGEPAPPFAEPGASVNRRALEESKEHRFEIPPVEPGIYQLCGSFSFRVEAERDSGRICADISIDD